MGSLGRRPLAPSWMDRRLRGDERTEEAEAQFPEICRTMALLTSPMARLHYDGAIHGFFTMGAHLDIGRRAIGDVSKAIVRHISGN